MCAARWTLAPSHSGLGRRANQLRLLRPAVQRRASYVAAGAVVGSLLAYRKDLKQLEFDLSSATGDRSGPGSAASAEGGGAGRGRAGREAGGQAAQCMRLPGATVQCCAKSAGQQGSSISQRVEGCT